MINLRIKAGMLVSQAISEVKSSRQKLSVDMLLIGAGVVGSDSSLSWIRKGQIKDILRYVRVLYEVTKLLPPERRDRYRLEMFELIAGCWWLIDFIKKIDKSEEKRLFSWFFERKVVILQKNCKYRI